MHKEILVFRDLSRVFHDIVHNILRDPSKFSCRFIYIYAYNNRQIRYVCYKRLN